LLTNTLNGDNRNVYYFLHTQAVLQTIILGVASLNLQWYLSAHFDETLINQKQHYEASVVECKLSSFVWANCYWICIEFLL